VATPFEDVQRGPRPHRLLAAICAVALAVIGLAAVAVQVDTTAASASTVSFSQCNDRGAGINGAPLTVTCSVSIVNNIDANGATSSSTYLRVCTLNDCTGDTMSSTDVINAVHQCNGSDNVGGSNTVCTVDIVNNISGASPAAATAINVNQCIGSGQGGGANVQACIASSQGSPDVTQCNGSGNGGGATLVCTASGTTSDAFPVTVDQCNGSENGGGSTVTCSTTITTNIFDTTTGPSGPPSGVPGGTPGTPGGGTPGTPTGTPGTPGTGTPGTPTGVGGPPVSQLEGPPVAPPVLAPPVLTG
jgi:hypothetical protein